MFCTPTLPWHVYKFHKMVVPAELHQGNSKFKRRVNYLLTELTTGRKHYSYSWFSPVTLLLLLLRYANYYDITCILGFRMNSIRAAWIKIVCIGSRDLSDGMMMWRTANSKDHYAASNSILFPSSIEILLDFGSHQANDDCGNESPKILAQVWAVIRRWSRVFEFSLRIVDRLHQSLIRPLKCIWHEIFFSCFL